MTLLDEFLADSTQQNTVQFAPNNNIRHILTVCGACMVWDNVESFDLVLLTEEQILFF
jgi:hypothetical protein